MNVNSVTQAKSYDYKLDEVSKKNGVAGANAKEQGGEGKAQAVVPDVDVYESSLDTEESRAALVKRLKAEQASIQESFLKTVRNTISRQGMEAVGGEGIWKMIAQGNFEVDPETKAAAQQAISEDGYWGVKQTSQRIVDFAKALAGNNPEMAETVKNAFIKGYKQAEEAWGGALPEICGQTYDAVMTMFDEWE